jgi:GNAT superfamily N-acetyltransferase
MDMGTIRRTTSDDVDFNKLVTLLDRELAMRDGSEHSFYAQFNTLDKIKNVVVYYEGGVAIGCGAFKKFDAKTVEVKRMFVQHHARGKGIGAVILRELESWARELQYTASILETGKKQPEAIRLYEKAGYATIPNFGQYKNVDNSICMKKSIA